MIARLERLLSPLCIPRNDDDAPISPIIVGTLMNELEDTLPSNLNDDELAQIIADTASAKSMVHYDYDRVAVTIATQHLRNKIGVSFSESMRILYENRHDNKHAPRVSEEFYDLVRSHAALLDVAICEERDEMLTYFGYKTLQRSYLLRTSDGTIMETPQYMWMRVALGINMHANTFSMEHCLQTYDAMSALRLTHATPTLFNAGTPRPQMSSCFLMQTQEDSIQGIYRTVADCAEISKYAGGIGIDVTRIRAAGSYIAGTGGHSNGLIPMLRVFNATARYVDQGGGKRKGSFAIYLEPWHADIEAFLELRLAQGAEEMRTRDLFTGLWVPDIFMRRVKSNGMWSLFCPTQAPKLLETYGQQFDTVYEELEQQGLAVKTIPARSIWMAILKSQMQTGTPYLLYKDACNNKSNQQNLGPIRCSNLCTEIVEYTAPGEEIAVCNLASLSLKQFIHGGEFDHAQFGACVRMCVRNLNMVIDGNYYPLPQCKVSNLRHRPIGLGVQGLADALAILKIDYDSEQGIEFDRSVFETLYYYAVDESCRLAKTYGPYESFDGSPASQGILQYDMWEQTEYVEKQRARYDWAQLKQDVQRFGLRNSLLVAPMPTASTSQILGNHTESFSPMASVLYVRRTLAANSILCMAQFIKDMDQEHLWTPDMRERVAQCEGEIDEIQEIPQSIKNRYRSAFAMSQRWTIDHAAARGPFICQSQSMNVWLRDITANKLSSLLFYGWSQGLKTGIYYLRSQARTKNTLSQASTCISCGS